MNRIKKDDDRYIYIGLFGLMFLLSLTLLRYAPNFPFILDDELGYMSYSLHYIYGQGEILKYWPGYGLFLMPIYLMANNDIELAYQITQYANRIVISLLPIVLYIISKNLFPKISKKIRVLFVIISCLYPTYLLYTLVSWAENILPILYLITILMFIRLNKNKTIVNLTLFLLSYFYLLLTHPRNLAVLPAVVIGLLAVYNSTLFERCVELIVKRWKLISLTIVILVVSGNLLLNNNEIIIFLNGLGGYEIGNVVQKAFSFKWVFTLLSQFMYLNFSTFGIITLGFINLFKDSIYQKKNDDSRFNITLFILISLVGLFVFSAIFMTDGSRADHVIYGRYNESSLTILIFCGLMYIKNHSPKNFIKSVSLVTILTTLSTIMIFKEHINNAPLNTVNILSAIGPMSIVSNFFNTGIYCILSILVICISSFILLYTKKAYYTFVVFLFLCTLFFSYNEYYIKSHEAINKLYKSEKIVDSYIEYKKKKHTSILYSGVTEYDFFITRRVSIRYGRKIAIDNDNPDLIIYNDSNYKLPSEYEILDFEVSMNIGIAMKNNEENYAFIKNNGYIPYDFYLGLEQSAYNGEIELSKYNLGNNEMELEISNNSDSNIWPTLASYSGTTYSIRGLISIYDDPNFTNIVHRQKFDIGEDSVYPNSTIDTTIPLRYNLQNDKVYYIRIELIHDGVGYFSKLGKGSSSFMVMMDDKATIKEIDNVIMSDEYYNELNVIYTSDLLLNHYKEHLERYLKPNLNNFITNEWTHNGYGQITNIKMDITDKDFLVLESNGHHIYDNNLEKLDLKVRINGDQLYRPIMNKNNKYYFDIEDRDKIINNLEVFSKPFTPSKLPKLLTNTYDNPLRFNFLGELTHEDGNSYGIGIKKLYGENRQDLLSYNFGSDNEIFNFTGFSERENGFRWTNSSNATVSLIIDSEKNYNGRINIKSPVPLKDLNRSSFSGCIQINKGKKQKFSFDSSDEQRYIEFVINKGDLTEEENMLNIITDTWSPIEYGSEDARTLGIAIDDIILEEVK